MFLLLLCWQPVLYIILTACQIIAMHCHHVASGHWSSQFNSVVIAITPRQHWHTTSVRRPGPAEKIIHLMSLLNKDKTGHGSSTFRPNEPILAVKGTTPSSFHVACAHERLFFKIQQFTVRPDVDVKPVSSEQGSLNVIY